MTTFAPAVEFNRFSVRSKGLCVGSVLKRSQHSAYFLQLPYRIVLPVMLISGILHWLCSQCFFLVSVLEGYPAVLLEDSLDTGGIIYKSRERISLGYSPQAILVLGILSSILYAVIIGCSLRRFTCAMPLFGGCSAIISSMCHQSSDEDGNEMVLKPVMWGVCSEEVMYTRGAQRAINIVETSFSSRRIRQPVNNDVVIM